MSYKHIAKLISESTQTGSIVNGRPTLVSVTGKADNIIFTDLVATQATKTPNAAVYGISVFNTGKDAADATVKADIYHDPGTSTGEMGMTQGYALPEFDVAKAYTAGEQFKVETKGLFFEVASDVTFSGLDGASDYDKLMTGLAAAKVRVLTDAIPYGHDTRDEIAGIDFNLRKWDLEIEARKLKVSISNELIEDMRFNSMDSDALIDEIIASSIAMDINKDIIQKLINVSNRFDDQEYIKNGALDLTGTRPMIEKSRELYAVICMAASRVYERTTYASTYVICSPKVFSVLSGSGWVRPLKEESEDETLNSTLSGIMNNGMKIYVDRFPLFDYFVVGMQHELEGLQAVGSMYYSPYTENDGAGFITIVSPPSDFQPRIGVMVRYALSINNIYSNLTEEERVKVKANDWNKLMGKSEASQFVRVKF